MKTAQYECRKCKTRVTRIVDNGQREFYHCPTCLRSESFKRVRGTTVDSVKRIRHDRHNASFTVDTEVSEFDMRAACPKFFAFPHGRRETYTAYRGCLIVRHTVTFTGQGPQRLTVTYLFGRWPRQTQSDMFHADPDYPERLTSIAQAKRHLDAILDNGKCWQDLQTV